MTFHQDPEYLGDSVYVAHDNGSITLYLDNGEGPHTIIFMEPQVYRALRRYVRRVWPALETEGLA